MVWADLPRGGKSAGANYCQPARIVEARVLDSPRDGKRLLRVEVVHVGKDCARRPFSVLYFDAGRVCEVTGMFKGLFEGDGPVCPEELAGRSVFALTPGRYCNMTYGLAVA